VRLFVFVLALRRENPHHRRVHETVTMPSTERAARGGCHLKIAFIGAHGVGKTTLCYDLVGMLKRKGVDADIVKEVARLSPLPINQQTSLHAQTWILMTQVAEEIRSGAFHPVVVCDRSVLDNYAYLTRACGRHADIERFVDYWLTTYDVLFKVPVCGTAPPDGVRDVDQRFIHDIDALVDELLQEKRLDHVRLDPSHRDAWLEVVRGVLADRVAQPVRA
jgi:GTPase SAR1 family protein